MDKFSRTTEIDTAGVLSAIEEETPKKSRRGNIIALVICVIVAIFICAYVVDTNPEITSIEFSNVEVAVQSDEYNVVLKTQVDITVSGTISDIVDINRSDISVYISTESINIEGTYAVPIVCKLATPNENVEIESSVSLVLIQVTKK